MELENAKKVTNDMFELDHWKDLEKEIKDSRHIVDEVEMFSVYTVNEMHLDETTIGGEVAEALSKLAKSKIETLQGSLSKIEY